MERWKRAGEGVLLLLADCLLLSPRALGTVVRKHSGCRIAVLCHALCYDLAKLYTVYQHLTVSPPLKIL